MILKRKVPKMIFTDDAWMLSERSKIKYKDIENYLVDTFAGLDAAYWWSVGDHEVYHYETKIGERFGSGYEQFNENLESFVHKKTPGVVQQFTNNFNSLIDEYGGPLTVISEICRNNQIPFYPRVRMNSHYPIDFNHVGHGDFRRQHPDWLIGKPGEEIAKGTLEYGIRTGKDYSVPEVRSYMLEIICETFEQFDVDGVELDFCRHPAFFRLGDEKVNSKLITDLLYQVKTRLNKRENELGHPLNLAVRVPATVKDSVRIGLDVDDWIRSDLVNIVSVGIGFVPFDTPVRDFVDQAKDRECAIYGCLEGSAYGDPLVLRGAANWWVNNGATGVYLYNFFTMSAQWHHQTYNELTDDIGLPTSDKKYVLGKSSKPGPDGTIGWAFYHASPKTQLPMTINDETSDLMIEIADDLDDSNVKNKVDSATIGIWFENLETDTEIKLKINGESAGEMYYKNSQDGWGNVSVESLWWVKYPASLNTNIQQGHLFLSDEIKHFLFNGINRISLTLDKVSKHLATTVIVGVELKILYKKK